MCEPWRIGQTLPTGKQLDETGRREHNHNAMKKVFNALQWVVVLMLISVSTALVLSKFDTPFKYRIFSVNSGSMEPAVRVGSVAVVVPQDSYRENDIITFRSRRDPNQTTTHRLIQITQDKDLSRITYKTKGDANEDEDIGFVQDSQIVGKVLFSLPLLGYLVAFSKTQLGFTMLVIVPATIIVYNELNVLKKEIPAFVKARKEKKDKKTKPKKVSKKKEIKKSEEKKENVVPAKPKRKKKKGVSKKTKENNE